MARILGIGVATLDVVLGLDGYPDEDAKVRALSRRTARGGNAANTLVVLSRLGHRCTLAATLADDDGGRRVCDDLRAHGVDTGPCRVIAGGATPTSYVLHNRRNGSRTVVHYRDLPEYPAEAFARIALSGFDWCHFEGRNVEATLAMLRHLKTHTRVPCSLEVEKPRPGIERLFACADLLLFGRDYVRAHADDPRTFLRAMRAQLPAADLVCAWGEQGAYGATPGGAVEHAPACPPPRVVDTLGAGDTFNAGIIDARLRRASLTEGLRHACRLAGEKCGREGLAVPDRSGGTPPAPP